MEAVRSELRRLARGYARAVGGARAARWHLVILVSAIVLAFVHRALVALPLFDALVGQWIPALVAALALYALGPALRVPAVLALRPRPEVFARDLDDRFAWRDATETALTLEHGERARPVPAFLAAQAAGRLRGVHPHSLARAGRRPSRWLRRILAFLFAAVLLLPGVAGWWGHTGGPTPDDPSGGPRPMRADVWLQTFVENPLPVEPLPEAVQGGQGAERAESAKEAKRAGTGGGK